MLVDQTKDWLRFSKAPVWRYMHYITNIKNDCDKKLHCKYEVRKHTEDATLQQLCVEHISGVIASP